MILDIDFVIPYRAASWKRSLQGARDKLAWSGDYTASLEPRLIKVSEAGLGKTVKCCVAEPSHGYCC